MENLLFVYNPYSGKGKVGKHLNRILKIFQEGGYKVTIHGTQYAGDAHDYVQSVDGKYDVIVCSGGDGTLNEVVSAIITHQHKKPRVGYIPAGTTNDFAGSVGIPKNMERAADLIVQGKTIHCDLGTFNGRPFDYVVAFGMFSETSYVTNQKLKNIFGHLAYAMYGFRSLVINKPHKLRLNCDGERTEGEYIYGMISNSRSVGGFRGVAGSSVHMDDGRFEIALINNPRNPIEFFQMLAGFFNEKKGLNMVHRYAGSQIRLESDEGIHYSVDGEDGGEQNCVEIQVIHHAFHLIVGDTIEAEVIEEVKVP